MGKSIFAKMSIKVFIFATISVAATIADVTNPDTRKCRLNQHKSVEYHCRKDSLETPCSDLVSDGEEVLATCRANYYSPTPLPKMRCIGGTWDYLATCKPDCGTVVPRSDLIPAPSESANRGEVPWHAGVYRKTTTPYQQICGGSLVTANAVISAAHCFWDQVKGAPRPASDYAVAVGKLYRPWGAGGDDQAQKSDVREVRIPSRFRGSEMNYQGDIAILTLATPVQFNSFTRPVCLDFDVAFEKHQLTPGHLGKIASWGAVSQASQEQSITLQVQEQPYVEIERCISEVPPSFREYITLDKICAFGNDTSQKLCRGSGGSGLAFPESERGVLRYYLRGVASTAPTSEDDSLCSLILTYTQILTHEHFIKDNINMEE